MFEFYPLLGPSKGPVLWRNIKTSDSTGNWTLGLLWKVRKNYISWYKGFALI